MSLYQTKMQLFWKLLYPLLLLENLTPSLCHTFLLLTLHPNSVIVLSSSQQHFHKIWMNYWPLLNVTVFFSIFDHIAAIKINSIIIIIRPTGSSSILTLGWPNHISFSVGGPSTPPLSSLLYQMPWLSAKHLEMKEDFWGECGEVANQKKKNVDADVAKCAEITDIIAAGTASTVTVLHYAAAGWRQWREAVTGRPRKRAGGEC